VTEGVADGVVASRFRLWELAEVAHERLAG